MSTMRSDVDVHEFGPMHNVADDAAIINVPNIVLWLKSWNVALKGHYFKTWFEKFQRITWLHRPCSFNHVLKVIHLHGVLAITSIAWNISMVPQTKRLLSAMLKTLRKTIWTKQDRTFCTCVNSQATLGRQPIHIRCFPLLCCCLSELFNGIMRRRNSWQLSARIDYFGSHGRFWIFREVDFAHATKHWINEGSSTTSKSLTEFLSELTTSNTACCSCRSLWPNWRVPRKNTKIAWQWVVKSGLIECWKKMRVLWSGGAFVWAALSSGVIDSWKSGAKNVRGPAIVAS